MIEKTYLESVIKRFGEYKTLGDKIIERLTDADLAWQPNTTTNSIAIIIQHLHGNMLSRWTAFLTEDGEKPWRKRDEEFEVQSLSKAAILGYWEKGWGVVFQTLHSLQASDLLKDITIRTQPLSVVDAINRQLAHYSYHVGQMVFIGKWLQGENWTSLSIPKGGSTQFNDTMSGKHK
jgi:hypothetical protein